MPAGLMGPVRLMVSGFPTSVFPATSTMVLARGNQDTLKNFK